MGRRVIRRCTCDWLHWRSLLSDTLGRRRPPAHANRLCERVYFPDMSSLTSSDVIPRERVPSDALNEEQTLRVAKLRLEIAELRLQWWRRPQWFAALATVVAAIAGFAWAAITGYFDTRLREVRIETATVKKQRDELFSQTTSLQKDLARLRADKERLEGRLRETDIPLVTTLQFTDAPWHRTTPNVAIVDVGGVNFGSLAGHVTLSLRFRSMTTNKTYQLGEWPVEPKTWTATSITGIVAGLNDDAIINVYRRVVQAEGRAPTGGLVSATVSIQRTDGARSDTFSIQSTDATVWILRLQSSG